MLLVASHQDGTALNIGGAKRTSVRGPVKVGSGPFTSFDTRGGQPTFSARANTTSPSRGSEHSARIAPLGTVRPVQGAASGLMAVRHGSYNYSELENTRSSCADNQLSGGRVRIGFLGTLELVGRPGPVPNIEECRWHNVYASEGGALARDIMVFRVPGCPKSPSALD